VSGPSLGSLLSFSTRSLVDLGPRSVRTAGRRRVYCYAPPAGGRLPATRESGSPVGKTAPGETEGRCRHRGRGSPGLASWNASAPSPGRGFGAGARLARVRLGRRPGISGHYPVARFRAPRPTVFDVRDRMFDRHMRPKKSGCLHLSAAARVRCRGPGDRVLQGTVAQEPGGGLTPLRRRLWTPGPIVLLMETVRM